MLAGLLFAIDEAEDRPGTLIATLPVGGLTLVEHQARVLLAAGATQMVVAVARMTPELLGALERIRRRGAVVDAVRTAREAGERLHPLARVVMLADGLVTTEAVVGPLVGEGGDALLVVPAERAAAGWERVGAQMAWAGVARIDPARVGELARMPSDWDVQSALLRLADQAGAAHRLLPDGAMRAGHGIERRAAALSAHGRAVLGTLLAGRRSWFERWVTGTAARPLLPRLVERGIGSAAVGGAGAATGVLGLILIGTGMGAAGSLAALAGCVVVELGAGLADLRDEEPVRRMLAAAAGLVPAAAGVAIGMSGGAVGAILAAAGVIAGALAVRAADEADRRRWWATPPALLAAAAAGTVAGAPMIGLGAAGLYAAATLAAAVEALRRRALARP